MTSTAAVPALRQLIEKLPPRAARALLGEIDGGRNARGPLAAARSSLIRHLNGTRRQHARRLFTGLVEPFLVAEDALLDLHAPGFLHRADLGALWTALAEIPAVGRLGAAVDQEVAALAADRLVDEVLRSDVGRRLQAHLRETALRELDARRGDRAATGALLERVNAARAALLRQMRVETAPRRVGTADLDGWIDALRHAPALLDVAGAPVRPALLAERTRSCLAAIPAPEGRWSPGWLPLLAEIYRGRALDAAASALAALGPGEAARLPLHAALAVRLGASCRRFAACLRTGDAAAASRELPLLGGLMRLHETLDLFSARETGRTAALHVEEMIAGVEAAVLPQLAARAAAAAEAHDQVPDLDATLARLDCVGRWAEALRSRQLVWPGDREGWRRRLTERIAGVLKEVLLRRGADGERMAQLRRLARLADALGDPICERMRPVDRSYVGLLTSRLAEPEPLDEVERGLVERMAAKAEAELSLIRHWKDPDLVRFVELARPRLAAELAA
ncbi:hypothetical protein [Arenibaculum sp.]|uniref:hypothetical protein n=1 Tax=Arenibaculum sp. TaxID=2865862 RepID=UPI002E0E023E|nr:hypothetical protein [Arenibaculum sp.]